MRRRTIAVVGLTDDATHAFQSMLKIVDGRASANWLLVGPDEADVLMAGVNSNAPVIERWARTRKPLIAVQEGHATRPMSPFNLHHPFRVMQLLGVLDDVERELDSRTSASMPRATAESGASWAFAESLRLLSRRGASDKLYVSPSIFGPLYVRGDLGAWFASDEIHARLLRQSPISLPALERATLPVPSELRARSVTALAWFAGLHGPPGLAPWLDGEATYRLRRWPDFGLLRGTRHQLLASATLARRACTREMLCGITGQSTLAIDAFLNASSMTGLLATSIDSQVAQTEHSGGFTMSTGQLAGFLRGLRDRLGLSA
ncbi:MAG: hypothetical protein ABI411_16045 [Tahibacter sp.]